MMLRAWTLVGGLLMFAAAGAACSSADTPEDDGGDTGGGTSGSAGTAPTGGSAGTPSGGSAGTPSGGSAGTAAGGTAGTGNPAGCTGISRGSACPTEGQMCPGLLCGLADSGTRSCNCVGLIWECESCSFVGAWTENPPTTPIEPCPDGIDDEVACTEAQDHLICAPNVNGDTCACWLSPSDGQSWDCDARPSSWPAE
jgi:hypothetical protein